MLEQAMTAFGVDMDKPFEDLSEEDKNLILYGSDGKEFHSTMKMNLVVCVISTFLLRELSIISNVVTMKPIVTTRALRCVST